MKKFYVLISTACILFTSMQAGNVGDSFKDDLFWYEITNVQPKEVMVTGYDLNYTGTYPEVADIPSTATNSDEGVTYTVTAIRPYTFRNNSMFTGYKLPATIKEIGDQAFYRSYAESITLPEGLDSIGKEAFRESRFTSITVPKTVTKMGEYAFASCSQLTELTLPEGLTTLGEYAFAWCSKLATLTIPSTIKLVPNWCFVGCTGVTSLTISEGVETLNSSAFQGTGSQELVLPSTLKSISYNAFQSPMRPYLRITAKMATPTTDCGFDWETRQNALLIVPDGKMAAYKNESSWDFTYMKEESQPDPVFFVADGIRYYAPNETTCMVIASEDGYYDVTNVVIPATVTNPSTSKTYKVTALGDNCFNGSSIQSITLPEGIVTIGNEVFQWSGLETVNFPSTLKEIGGYAFAGTAITSAPLNEGLEILGQGCFVRCMNLASAVLPSTLVDVYEGEGDERIKIKGALFGALAMCPALMEVTSYIMEPHNDYVFRELPSGAVLTVPTGTLEKYCNTASSISWGAFSTIKDQSGKTANRFSLTHEWYGSVKINGENEPDDGFSVFAPAGKSYTFTIIPTKGYVLKSITLNGVDIINQMTNDSTITVVTDGNVQELYVRFSQQMELTESITTYYHWMGLDFSGSEDVKAYIVDNYYNGSQVVTLVPVDSVPAYTGFVLVGKVGAKYTLDEYECDYSPASEKDLLRGMYANTVAFSTEYRNSKTHYNYKLVPDASAQFKYSFIPIETEGDHFDHPWAYLSIPYDQLSWPVPEKININIPGLVGINGVKKNIQNDAVYDLQGRRIINPRHGIFIKNGRKVVLP